VTELTELEREFEQSWVKQELIFAYIIIQHKVERFTELYKVIQRTSLPPYEKYRTKLRAHKEGLSIILSRATRPELHRLLEKPHLQIALDQGTGFRVQCNNMRPALAHFSELTEGDEGIRDDVLLYLDELMTYPID